MDEYGNGNPENNHLSNLCYGTPSENSIDMYRHGYKGRRKLDEEQVRDMRRMAKRGAVREELAEWFGVSPTTVSGVCHGVIYEDCPGPVIDRLRQPHAKLSDGQVVEIRRKLQAGAVGRDLASQYGVHESTISLIKSGKRRESVYAKADQD